MNKGLESMKTQPVAMVGVVLALGSMLLGSSGCTAVGRGMGSMTASKYARPEAGFTWNIPAPELDPPPANRRTVFLSVRNISAAPEIDINGPLRQGIANLGYQIVNDPDEASFRMRVTIRYFGENEAADGGQSQARILGGIAGAATGVTTGVMVARGTGSAWAGGIGGGVVGSVVGMGVANATKPREWNLIADVLLEERLDRAIEIAVTSDRDTVSTTGSQAVMEHDRTQRQDVGGRARGTTTASASAVKTTNYFPHGVRVTGWARQIAMTSDEAIPMIHAKLAAAPAGLLP